MTVYDFSEWNSPDWDVVVKDPNLEGVILRVQSGYTHPDKKYKQFVSECKRRGIKFASYAYLKPVSTNDAVAEAVSYSKLVDADSVGHIADIEVKTCSDLVSAGQSFFGFLKKAGFKNFGLYSGEYFFRDNNLNAIERDFTWIANYSKQPIVQCDMWQYSSAVKLGGVEVDASKILGKNIFPPASPFIQVVKVIAETDVRADHSHDSGFIKQAHVNEFYNVVERFGDWHRVVLDDEGNKGWIDGNNGQNLYWVR